MKPVLRTTLVVAGLTCVSCLVTGYRFPEDNHAIQIELVRHLTGGGLDHDPFVATLDHYASPLWHALAWLSRGVGLPLVLGCLFLVTRVLAIVGAARLGHALLDDGDDARSGWWGGALFATLGPASVLGAGTIVPRYAEQTSLAVALWMLAAAWFLQRRRWPWAAALGAMALCNSLYALYAVVFFGAGAWARWLVREPDTSRRSLVRPWLGPIALAVVIAVPAVWMGVVMVDQVTPASWMSLARVRFVHHLQPLTSASLWQWLQCLAMVALAHQVAMSLRAEGLERGGEAGWQRMLRSVDLRLWNAVGLLWIALGVMSGHGESAPHALVELQPTRGTDLWVTIVGVTSVGYALQRLRHDPRLQTRWARLAAVALVAVLAAHWRGDVRQVLVVAGVVVCVAALWRQAGTRPAVVAVALGALVSGLVFKAPLFAAHGPAALLGTASQRYAYAELAEVVAARVDEDAVVVVDPRWDMFRVLSGRSVYVTWKDGAAMLWSPDYAETWAARMRALGLDPRDAPPDAHERLTWLEQGYRRVEPRDIAAIADEVDVWIVPADEVGQEVHIPGVEIVRVERGASGWAVVGAP